MPVGSNRQAGGDDGINKKCDFKRKQTAVLLLLRRDLRDGERLLLPVVHEGLRLRCLSFPTWGWAPLRSSRKRIQDEPNVGPCFA